MCFYISNIAAFSKNSFLFKNVLITYSNLCSFFAKCYGCKVDQIQIDCVRVFALCEDKNEQLIGFLLLRSRKYGNAVTEFLLFYF